MEFDSNLSPQQNLDSKVTIFSLSKRNNCFDGPTEQMKNAVLFLILKMVNDKNESEKLTDAVFKEARSQLSPNISKYNYSSWLFQLASKKAKKFLVMKKDKEIAEINQSNVKSKNDKKRLNKTVWQKLTLDKSYLQLCMDRYALYLNETMNTEVLNLKMYSTSEIAYQLAQQFEDINYRTN